MDTVLYIVYIIEITLLTSDWKTQQRLGSKSWPTEATDTTPIGYKRAGVGLQSLLQRVFEFKF